MQDLLILTSPRVAVLLPVEVVAKVVEVSKLFILIHSLVHSTGQWVTPRTPRHTLTMNEEIINDVIDVIDLVVTSAANTHTACVVLATSATPLSPSSPSGHSRLEAHCRACDYDCQMCT